MTPIPPKISASHIRTCYSIFSGMVSECLTENVTVFTEILQLFQLSLILVKKIEISNSQVVSP